MKVAVVTMLFPAAAETFAARDIRSWRDQGVSVSVHCLRPPSSRNDTLRAVFDVMSVPVTYATVGGYLGGLLEMLRQPLRMMGFVARIGRHEWRQPASLLRCLALAPRAMGILAEIRRTRPDVVHLYWGHFPSLVGDLVRRHLPEVRLSHFLGAYDLERGLALSRKVYRRADVRWTHARANLPALQAWDIDPATVQVLHRGIDLEQVERALAGYHGTPFRTGRILTVARLYPGKGVDRAIRVVRILEEQGLDVNLTVIGEGPERERLGRLASELGVSGRINFLGYVPPDAVFTAMAGSRVFLLLSDCIGERLPNVVKEAMYCGCHCISAASPGIEELIADPVFGDIVDTDDLEAAAERVRQALRCGNGGRSTELARSFIRENFDVRRSAQVYLTVWRQLLGYSVVDAPPSAYSRRGGGVEREMMQESGG